MIQGGSKKVPEGWEVVVGFQGAEGVKGTLLPSTLTMKMRLSWGMSHRYSPASPLRAPRTRSTCLAPACQALPVLVPAHRGPWPGEVHHQL
jgi:hypothetical protein